MLCSKNFLFLGKSGIGKSTLINALIGTSAFKAQGGVKSITYCLSANKSNLVAGVEFIDAPGLSAADIKLP